MNVWVVSECVERPCFCFELPFDKMSDAPAVTVSAKFKSVLDVVTDRVTEWIPKNLNIWLIALTCLIVLVALSRLLSLQKSVSELQTRPSVDEHLVRQVVRQHLEETVRAMDQQNRVQLQMRQQQMMEQARKAQQAMLEKQKEFAAVAPSTKIEILESGPAVPAPAPSPIATVEKPVATVEQPVPVAVVEQPIAVEQAVPVLDAATESPRLVDSVSGNNPPASPAPRTKRHKAKPIAV